MSQSNSSQGSTSERDRLARELHGAESFEALPPALKAAVAETAGDAQVAGGMHFCLCALCCCIACVSSWTLPAEVKANVAETAGDAQVGFFKGAHQLHSVSLTACVVLSLLPKRACTPAARSHCTHHKHNRRPPRLTACVRRALRP